MFRTGSRRPVRAALFAALCCLALAGLLLVTADTATAQGYRPAGYHPRSAFFPPPIYYPPPRTTILGSALQPGAQVMIPGSGQLWQDPVTGAMGFRYRGVDGLMHGTTEFTDPVTGGRERIVWGKRPRR